MQLKDLLPRDARDENAKAIAAAYEKDTGLDDSSLIQCPNCSTVIDTNYYLYCGVCSKLNKKGYNCLTCGGRGGRDDWEGQTDQWFTCEDCDSTGLQKLRGIIKND